MRTAASTPLKASNGLVGSFLPFTFQSRRKAAVLSVLNPHRVKAFLISPEFLFTPEINNPVFLEARAGLGHSLMSLNSLVHTATTLRLTLRVDMRAAGAKHDVSSDFANGLFEDHFTAAFPARCSDLRIIPMKYDELSTAVSKIRKEKNATGLCFVVSSFRT